MGTHEQLLYHVVFSTKEQKPALTNGFREKVFASLSSLIRERGGYVLGLGGHHDHVHLLVRIPARTSVADFVGELKTESIQRVNDSDGDTQRLAWQDGFAAFTVSPLDHGLLAEYIENQMDHHEVESFEDELIRLLESHAIRFDKRQVFD